MLKYLAEDINANIFFKVNDCVYKKIFVYINKYKNTNVNIDKNEHEIMKKFMDTTSSLIYKSYIQNYKLDHCKDEIKDEINLLCENVIERIFKDEYDKKFDLAKFVRLINIYEKSYLSIILKKLTYIQDSRKENILIFLFDFFNDIEYSFISVWNEFDYKKKYQYEEEKIKELQNEINKKIPIIEKKVNDDKRKYNIFVNMSHEIKTPVNVIFSAIQLFELHYRKCGNGDESICKYLSVMKQNCYRLTKLVNNLIDLSKIEDGFYKLNKSNCNIVNVIENISLSVVDYAHNNGINLIFDTDVEEKIMACDIDKIERIMLNLLSNAIKFTKEDGYIYVNLKDKGSYIEITVKDTGVGISKEKQDVIFDKFVQCESNINMNKQGSGIGLFLVKSLVQMHNGEIKLESKINEGTKFTIKLPISILEDEDCSKENNFLNDSQKINIEFSDINLK